MYVIECRWSLIAGRLPGRTANDVKNFWNTNFQKKLTTTSDHVQKQVVEGEELINRKQTCSATTHEVVKPLPRTLSKGASVPCCNLNTHCDMHSPLPGEIIYDKISSNDNNNNIIINKITSPATPLQDQEGIEWWKDIFAEIGTQGQEDGSLEGQLMASSGGLKNLEAESGLIWKKDESFDPATATTILPHEDVRSCWSDILDLLNQDYS